MSGSLVLILYFNLQLRIPAIDSSLFNHEIGDMYVVIFRAQTHNLDSEYFATADHLREIAKTKYGCLEFVSVSEGDEEITLSYWSSLEQIQAWRQDPVHHCAQQTGK